MQKKKISINIGEYHFRYLLPLYVYVYLGGWMAVQLADLTDRKLTD